MRNRRSSLILWRILPLSLCGESLQPRKSECSVLTADIREDTLPRPVHDWASRLTLYLMHSSRTPAKVSSLRPCEAANFLRIGLSTFWLWAKTRPDFPPIYKIGRGVSLVDEAALSAWRDSQVKIRR